MGVYRDCPNFLSTPIISGTGKATNLRTFVRTFLVSIGTSLLQISGKVAGCLVRTLKTFQGSHILGASRGLLCDSSAVLFSSPLNRSIGREKREVFAAPTTCGLPRHHPQKYFCYMLDSKTDHLNLLCNDFSTNLTIPCINGCITCMCLLSN